MIFANLYDKFDIYLFLVPKISFLNFSKDKAFFFRYKFTNILCISFHHLCPNWSTRFHSWMVDGWIGFTDVV